MHTFCLFSLNSGSYFAKEVARQMGTVLSEHEEREFEDKEHKIRPLVNIRGKHVFVIQSLYSDATQSVNDKLCRLLFFIGALKDAAAAEITVVVPYLCYARKDRKTKPRDPVTTRYVACLFEAVGTSRVVTLDVHNLQAFQNAFRCQTEHLDTVKLFANHFASSLAGEDIVIMSPDIGGMKRVASLKERLDKRLKKDIPIAVMEKHRSGGIISGTEVLGEFTSKTVLILDDLISSGSTLARAAQTCKDRGAKKIIAAATHGVFSENSENILSNSPLDSLVVTNTIPPSKLSDTFTGNKLQILDTSPLFAEAILRIYTGGSIVELLEG